MNCPWCSYDNLPRAKFCGDCGRGLQADAVCDSCATRNPIGHRFCDACGTPFADPGPLPATPTPPRSAASAPMPRTQWIASASDGLAQARARLEKLGLYGWEAAALIAIVVLALMLRLVSLTSIPPNVLPDEADNLQVIYHIMADTGPGFFGIDWAQSPAFSLYLVSWFMQVFGETIAGMRMANVVLSTLSLPVFYFVARQNDLGRPAALAATLLLATSLWYLHFSRTGWYNIHVALYALLAVLAATAAIRRGNLALYAATGLFAALGLYGYPGGRVIIVALAAYLPIALLLHREDRRRLLVGYAVMVAIAMVLFLPHLNFAVDNWEGYNTRAKAVYILNEENRVQFGDKNAVEIMAEQTWRNFKGFILLDSGSSYVGLNARYIPGGRGFLDRLTAVLFWLGMAVSILRWRHTLLWWLFFIMMLFPVQVLSNATPDGARAVAAAPFFYLFVALALDWLLGLRFRERWLVGSAVAVAVSVIAYMNVSGYFDWMDRPETAAARQPAIEVADFEQWQTLQKIEAEAGRRGFNVSEWLEMKEQGSIPTDP